MIILVVFAVVAVLIAMLVQKVVAYRSAAAVQGRMMDNNGDSGLQ